jgi:hypothetical protein
MRATSVAAPSLLVLGLVLAGALRAESTEAIGTVVTTLGAITVRDASGATRPLERRSQLFAGDTVTVVGRGFTSIRMVDNARISLGEDTQFVFERYRYDDNNATPDSVVLRLERGCFRAIVGSAGRARRDEYRVATPIATITTNDAFHGATLAGQRLYTAAWEGTTLISNPAGSLRLGQYGDTDYSRTFSEEAPTALQGLRPEVSCEPPESLDQPLTDRRTTIITR